MRVPRSSAEICSRMRPVPLATVAAVAALMAPAPAAAQADFYKGKTIDLVISTGVGGGLDANARVVARHLADHIPGSPTIVPRNMPGAGHIRAANFNWLASTSSSNSTVYVWHTSGAQSVEDATRRQVLMGGTGAGSYTL